METKPTLERWSNLLVLNRTVTVVLVTVLFFGLGEQLWETFMPAYLEARVKSHVHAAGETGQISWQALAAIGLYASLRNLFEGFCYIGGGQLTARLGDRGSLILFALMTLAGYVLFLASASPVVAIAAAMLILGWEPLSVPVTFTTVGSSVVESKRGMAFAVQSIQKRLPKIIGPVIAGLVIAWAQRQTDSPELGRVLGMRYLVAAALVLGLVSLAIQFRFMPHREPEPQPDSASALQIFRQFPPALRRLLLAEVFTRWCDWLVRAFVVVYVLLTLGQSDRFYGAVLTPLQHLTALATYLPIGAMTRKFGLRPFIGVTFIFFALFPLSLAWSPPGWGLTIAFVVYGLREIGEPARKAMITTLLPEPIRARGVGLYWGLRSFAFCSAPLAGATIWHLFGPQVLLHAAFLLGCCGAIVFFICFRRAA